MKSLSTWRKAWELLDARERRQALILIGILLGAAAMTSVMVSSILPFLMVLGDSTAIEKNRFLSSAYDLLGFQSAYAFLVALGIASLMIIALASAAQILRAHAIANFSAGRVQSLSSRLFRSYIFRPYEFFLGTHTGDLGAKILNESQQADANFYRPASEIIAAAASCLAILGLVLWYSPVLAIGSIAVVGGIYGATYAYSKKRLQTLAKAHFSANKERFRISIDSLAGIKDIKILGREQKYFDRFEVSSRAVAKAQAQTGVAAETPNFVLQALAFGGMIALGLVLLDPNDFDNQTAIGEILPVIGLFAFAGQRLLPELQRIYSGLTKMHYGDVAIDAIFEDLVTNAPASTQIADLHEDIRLRKELMLDNVSYSYPGAHSIGLNELSVSILAGEKIGVVGSSGAGKSTLANLVLGLIQPSKGTLVVDGNVVNPANLRAWQRNVGYVPQDIFMIDASLRENIALGLSKEEIDEGKVQNACRIAQLETLIRDQLNEGLDTRIGERGIRISGGQRQRIGIARALYNNADLLVFDEATSALDRVTEAEVMEAIESLPEGKTTLLIAHRMTTVMNCDRIIVLDAGEIVGVGTWSALMQSNEQFQKLASEPDEVDS